MEHIALIYFLITMGILYIMKRYVDSVLEHSKTVGDFVSLLGKQMSERDLTDIKIHKSFERELQLHRNYMELKEAEKRGEY